MIGKIAAVVGVGLMVLAIAPVNGSLAQQTPPSDARAVMAEIEKLKQHYDAQFDRLRQDYESRLTEMEARLKASETKATDQAQAEKRSAGRSSREGQSSSAFNPAIGVVLNGTFGKTRKEPETAHVPGFATGDESRPLNRGFSLGESEVNISASADHALYGEATIAFTRENTVAVEEAFIQTTALPLGFSAKAGRFFSDIGYLNRVHAHAWDFVDQALPYRVFLNGQYGDDGAQLKWLAPTGGLFLELGGEGFRGASFPGAGAAHAGVGSYSAFMHTGGDLNVSHSVRAGVSSLWTNAVSRATDDGTLLYDGRTNTTILDFVYKWAPNGDPSKTNLKLQAEYFFAHNAGTYSSVPYAADHRGWYAQAIYQFAPHWATGIRYDELTPEAAPAALTGTVLNPRGQCPRRYSAMLQFMTSEYGRFRLQYTRDNALNGTKGANEYLFQYTVSLGAHGAHPY